MECKATLEFSLPEQEYDFSVASKAVSLAVFIWNIKQALRAKRKYPSTLEGDEKVSWAEVEDFFNYELSASGINDLIEFMP